MNLFNLIKNIFYKSSTKEKDYTPEVAQLSIIDTSELEINRKLTDDEIESRNKLFEEISLGNISTFINYGNDISKQINFYIEMALKKLNRSLNISDLP